MRSGPRSSPVLLLVLALSACSAHVPRKDLPGAYVVHYPYGVVTLVLHRNGTFTQTAVVFADPIPKTVTGTWRRDRQDDYVEARGALHVDDAFGQFNPRWRVVSRSSGSWAPECDYFRVILNSGAPYPYVKQGGFTCPILGVLPRWPGAAFPGTVDDLTGGDVSEDHKGHQVCPNGVRVRPGRPGQGPRIDIPANGQK